MPTVRLARAGTVEAEVTLDERDLRLGRATDNDVALSDPDKTTSRHHAEFRREGDRWFYLDLNSANGSWIGERRVTRQELTPGLSITLGDYELTVVGVPETPDAVSGDLDATFLIRRDADTLIEARGPAAPRAAAAARASAPARPARSPQVVGGAVSVGAAAAPGPPQSSPIFRRIIIYGSIVVFGAFAIMLAALLRPETVPAEETAPASTGTPASTSAASTGNATLATPVPPSDSTTAAPAPGAPLAQTEPPATPPAAAVPGAPSISPAPTNRTAAGAPRVPPRIPARPLAIPDTDPDALAIPAQPGEEPVALRRRREDIRRRYALALQHLSAQQFIEARDLLGGVARDAPGFRDVGARMAETEARMRQQATEGFKAAARLEESGEWSDALRAYERLRPFAGSLPGLTEAVDRTRKRMHEAGAEALTRARQYDSRGRVPEAIAWYQRAVNWLPPDHPGLDAARKRLAELVNRP